MGIIWGYLGLTGAFGILSFVAANSAAVYVYSCNFFKTSNKKPLTILITIILLITVNFNEEQEDAITGVKEGFMTAFASFLVTWIIIYTSLYF